MDRRSWRTRAFSLIEMVAVLALLGVVAGASFGVFGLRTVGNATAQGFARRVVLDLMQARRRTIATGDNHYLLCALSGAVVESYQLKRRAAGGDVVVDQVQVVSDDVTVVTSHAVLEFDFDGAALNAYVLDVSGPDRSWQVTTTMTTGTAAVAETTP